MNTNNDLWTMFAFAMSIAECNQGGGDSLWRVTRYVAMLTNRKEPRRVDFESMDSLKSVFSDHQDFFNIDSLCDLLTHRDSMLVKLEKKRPYLETPVECPRYDDIEEGGHNGFNRNICGPIWWEIMYLTASYTSYTVKDFILWFRFIGELVSLFPCKTCRYRGFEKWMDFLEYVPIPVDKSKLINEFHKRCHGSDEMIKGAHSFYCSP